MVLNIVSSTILDASYIWLTFLGVFGFSMEQVKPFEIPLSLPLALCGVLNRPQSALCCFIKRFVV